MGTMSRLLMNFKLSCIAPNLSHPALQGIMWAFAH